MHPFLLHGFAGVLCFAVEKRSFPSKTSQTNLSYSEMVGMVAWNVVARRLHFAKEVSVNDWLSYRRC